MATFNPGHRDKTSFYISIDSRLSEEGIKGMKLDKACTKKKFKQIVRSELAKVKKALTAEAKAELPSDPRAAYKAIRTNLYKQTLGGNVTILEPKNKVHTSNYEAPRKLRPGQVGGNRAKRSYRTKQVLSYYGPSRAFILRFKSFGTIARTAGTRGSKFVGADRGAITPSNWFTEVGEKEIIKALDRLGEDIVKQVVKDYKEG